MREGPFRCGTRLGCWGARQVSPWPAPIFGPSLKVEEELSSSYPAMNHRQCGPSIASISHPFINSLPPPPRNRIRTVQVSLYTRQQYPLHRLEVRPSDDRAGAGKCEPYVVSFYTTFSRLFSKLSTASSTHLPTKRSDRHTHDPVTAPLPSATDCKQDTYLRSVPRSRHGA